MSLILAIEPDHRQAARLADLIRGRLNADLVHAHTTEGALTALAGIGDRVPDLVLVPSLLSAHEDAAIAGALRMIAAAANVRMLTIPMLADPEQLPAHRSVFAKLRGRKAQTTPGGCDPAVFAEQIAAYLAEAAAERRARAADADLLDSPVADVAPLVAATIAAHSDSEIPLTAGPVAEEMAPPLLEPVLEALIELTPVDDPAPVPEPVFAPVLIALPPPPVAVVEVHRSVILDEPEAVADTPLVLSDAPLAPSSVEEPRSIWLDGPHEPIVEPERAITSREPPAELMVVQEEPSAAIEEPGAAVAMAAEPAPAREATVAAADEIAEPVGSHVVAAMADTPVSEIASVTPEPVELPAPVVMAETPSVATIEEALPGVAIEEALPGVASEKAPQVVTIEQASQVGTIEDASQILAIEEVLQALALEDTPQAVAIEDAPVVVALPEAPVAPERLAASEAVADPKPVVARRRRKAVRPVASESDDRFDIDALLAPLLSEIAAKRAAPATTEQRRVAPAVEDAPATAVRAPEVIPPLPVTTVESPEPVAVPQFAVVPAVEPTPADQPPVEATPVAPILVASTLVEPTLVETMAVESPVVPTAVEPMPVEPTPVAATASETDIDPMFFAEDVPDGAADPAPHDRPAWVELIESLRKDIERLKAERPQPEEPAASVTVHVDQPQAPRIGRVLSIAAARPASQAPATPGSKLPTVTPRTKAAKPIQDQWGLFDPEQCGFAALRAKLDEIGAREDASV